VAVILPTFGIWPIHLATVLQDLTRTAGTKRQSYTGMNPRTRLAVVIQLKVLKHTLNSSQAILLKTAVFNQYIF